MKNTKIKKMVILGLMLAIEIVLSRFLSIQTATMKLAFNFIPVALVALMYGPISVSYTHLDVYKRQEQTAVMQFNQINP